MKTKLESEMVETQVVTMINLLTLVRGFVFDGLHYIA